tara:strand:- start:111 stop:1820 length:1710 start_codon:yes stop_codon:yes gene_type:complete
MNENNEDKIGLIATGLTTLSSVVTEMEYMNEKGILVKCKIPTQALEHSIPVKFGGKTGHTLCIIRELKTGAGIFRPEYIFRGERHHVIPLEKEGEQGTYYHAILDMVDQGADIKNIQKFMDTYDKVKANPQNDIVDITAHDKEAVIWVADDGPEDEIPDWVDDEPVWNGALLAGGRMKKTAPWDFSPTFLPNHVVVDGQAVRVNKKDGSANSWSIFNPLLANEKRPAGALLGSVSDRYFTLGHPTWVNPILKYAEMSGINTSVTSWNEGAKCRVDLDVTQATQLRQSAAERLKAKGAKFLDTDSLSEASQNLDGLYKFGFVINNSLDGRGSFGSYGTALRTYCQNLAVAGGVKSALKMRHTKGVMGDVDWDEFGLNLVNATAELNEWLINTELMSWIPIDLQMMDRLMFAMQENGLMTPPRLVKNKETGETTQVNRSHMDLAVTQGWKQPTLDYVAVQGEQKNTLYHLLQCVTGAITHKPTVHDDKRELKGSVLGFDTMDSRLKKVNQLFTNVASTALLNSAILIGNNDNKMRLENKNDVRAILKENPKYLGEVSEMPRYTEHNEIKVL